MFSNGNTFSIYGSVGAGGINLKNDVMLIQQLINAKLPTPLRLLAIDGKCSEVMVSAIKEIQRRNLHAASPDGRVDPGGATFSFLAGGKTESSSKGTVGSGVFPPDVVAAAQSSEKMWKIPAAVTLAQWALESNWGKAMPPGSHNPFGIKARAGQAYVEAKTKEVLNGKEITIVAKFRKYSSISDAFDEHGSLLASASPYAHARSLVGNPDAFADALTGVYATDPNYGTSLKRIMKTYNLYQYD